MDAKTEEELFYAINRDDPSKLQRLLLDGADPNTIFDGCDPLGKPLFWFPLHFCGEKGRLECARVLLDAGANPDAGDQWCMTPLMYAIRTEWHNMVELLLSRDYSGTTVDLQDTRGRTPLHFAVECSDDVCVQMLCAANADVNIRDLVGRTPLWTAVNQDGRIGSVGRLIKAGCNVNNADKRDKRTPLQVAIVYAQKDRLDYVRQLLEAGSVVNHRDEANLNSMLNLLSKSKRSGKGVTEDDLQIAKMIIDAGYHLNDLPYRSSWHKYGGTAIQMAAEQGATELVKLFLEHGADPDIGDDSGVTPLMSAALSNEISTAAILLRKNCKLEATGEVKVQYNSRQMSAVQCALARGHFKMARLLIECGGATYTLESLNEQNIFEPPTTQEVCDFWFWYLTEASNPAPLVDLCIRKVRKTLGLELEATLERFILPSIIKGYLKLEYILNDYV